MYKRENKIQINYLTQAFLLGGLTRHLEIRA